MKTYTIGEFFSAFNDTDYIGYIYTGKLKGRIIVCDTEKENRLMWIKPDGEVGYDFYVGVTDQPIEEVRNFVLFHELDDNKRLQFEIAKALTKTFINGLWEYDIED